jgi:ferric-dicitrate binding protein FerR (iron transport regulator)
MQSTSSSPYQEWLDRYAAGTISPADKAALMAAIANGQIDDTALHRALHQQWQAGTHASTGALPFDKTNLAKLATDSVETGRDGQPASMRRWWWAAAAILLVALAALGLFGRFLPPVVQLAKAAPAGYLQVQHSGAGLRSCSLPDGSTVQLADGASLQYPASFDSQSRQVYLQGDAFFEVAHRPDQPFTVHGQAMDAKVLGTSFWMRQSATDGSSQVQVLTGRVQVQAVGKGSQQTVIVTANQQVAYQPAVQQLAMSLPDTLRPLPRPAGSPLRFARATPLPQVLAALQQAYGITIRVQDARLNNCLVTGDLTRNDLRQSLEVLCLSVGASYHEDGLEMVISGPGCDAE